MRAQLSMLLLPNTARASFWTRKISSLVQRELDTAPIDFAPWRAWMRRNSLAVWRKASSQLTACQGSSIECRMSGVRTRSGCW